MRHRQGVCRFEYGTPPGGADYLVLGHEALGIIEDAGANVTRVKQGDLAAVMVRRPCHNPACNPCQAGRQDFCYTGEYFERGIDRYHGFMTSYVVDQQEYVCPIPSELRDIAVLTEPLTIAEKGLQQMSDVQDRLPWGNVKGHRAVVLGAGPVGLLGAMALRVRRGRSQGPGQRRGFGCRRLAVDVRDNVVAVKRVITALLPQLRASVLADGGCADILNVTSIAGHVAYAGGGGYNAAKFAAHAMMAVLRLELNGEPIRVIEVAPGMVQTEEFSLVRFEGDQDRADAVYDEVPDRSWPTTSPTRSCTRSPGRRTSTST